MSKNESHQVAVCAECGLAPRLDGRTRCRSCHNKRQRELRKSKLGIGNDTVELPCECGCGEIVTTYSADGRYLNRYIYGHLENVIGTTQECECGCGAIINAFAKGGKRRHFLKGHYDRPPRLEGDLLVAAKSGWSKTYAAKIRQQVMDAYGGKCACCGESELAFLTIDHVDRNGADHRRTHGYTTGLSTYRWLLANDCPQGEFQCLCWNCNSGREMNGGICPHEEARLAKSQTS